ncbi:hypothetical protein LTR36_008016 [Oleoguttula mirabilis]|uniref:molybdopterin adenylyltransferase n=1 Tax=Oleoguttula mirabilis TaxID=1507867 RepID=A0AAV9J9B5_9PEZI|nr:hypothetical protein LTR36_008016 [Oleoguttula mirabilis]
MARVISYAEARSIIGSVASQKAFLFAQDEQRLPIDQAIGHISKTNLRSPTQTPVFDSATMHGYAVIAHQTTNANSNNPTLLRVLGHTTAGDMPLEVDDEVLGGCVPCVEIEVGSAFPVGRSTQAHFDGLIPVEHTRIVREGGEGNLVEARSPPLTSFHKRLAGSDFHKNDSILEKGNFVQPRHVMALASVGITDIPVARQVRVGVISVGSELVATTLPHQHDHRDQQPPLPHKIPDANGYYLTAALREMGVDGIYLGAVPSDAKVLTAFLRDLLAYNSYDVIIASEGAMSGRIEQIPRSIFALKGEVHFSHVLMSPDGATIFASLPAVDQADVARSAPNGFHASGVTATDRFISPPKTPGSTMQARMGGEVVFFGLPGAPISSAASFRFLVTPYIRCLRGMPVESAMLGKVVVARSPTTSLAFSPHNPVSAAAATELIARGNAQMDIFRHGNVMSGQVDVTVEISREQSPTKTNPFASSNCWVHIPRGHEGVGAGSLTWIYPFCSPRN